MVETFSPFHLDNRNKQQEPSQWTPGAPSLRPFGASISAGDRQVPEGVSDAVVEVEEASPVLKQQVSRVEIDVPDFENVPQELLLGLFLVPSIAQELVDSSQWSHQDPGFSWTTTQLDFMSFTRPSFRDKRS